MQATPTLNQTSNLRRLLQRLWASQLVTFIFEAMASVNLDTTNRG